MIDLVWSRSITLNILQGLRAQDPVAFVGGMVDMLLKQGGDKLLSLLAKDWYARLDQMKGQQFTAVIGDPRELAQTFAVLQRRPEWAGRIDNSGRAPSGVSRNYSPLWSIQPAS